MAPERNIDFNPTKSEKENLDWIELKREIFDPETLGYKLFPDSLEGRKRPPQVLEKKAKYLFISNTKAARFFEEIDEQTIFQVLNSPEDFLQKGLNKELAKNAERKIGSYLNSLKLTNHARLIERVFDFSGTFSVGPQLALSPGREGELIETVEQEVAKLEGEKRRQVIIHRYGLHDGIYKKYPREISDNLGFISTSIHGIEVTAIRHLRRSPAGAILASFLTIPTKSLGRKLFKLEVRKDVHNLLARVRQKSFDGLSSSAEEELARYGFWKKLSPAELLTINFQGLEISEKTYDEIERKLQEFLD